MVADPPPDQVPTFRIVFFGDSKVAQPFAKAAVVTHGISQRYFKRNASEANMAAGESAVTQV